ncbi:MAG TPA: amidase [Verrucomicrobiae bacterium]|nr:amidase [Verrucomicrobiae bacterium]
MKRRTFLQLAVLGGAPLATGITLWGVTPKSSAPAFRLRPFEWEEATIDDLQAAMRSGHETAVSLAEKYSRRIEEVDWQGPRLKSVLELNPDATAIARALDRERRASGPRGPLHGVPILLKDNIDTHDRMMTTAGSLALLGSIAARDSFVAERLRAAGAVILGKTNLSEWANFRSNHSSSGWSGRGGQTRNPYVLDRNPSGSSSGSGAAVSASLCAAAVGTETDGSIISPSSFCGIVGIKPTLGLVSRAGIIPIAHSQDTAGPMARTVRDAAILLGALTGTDPRDPVTSESNGHAQKDYTTALSADGLRGARIGVARKFFRPRSRGDKVVEGALELIRGLGATVVDPADLPTHGQFGDSEYEVLLYEFKADLNKYLGGLPPGVAVHSLADVIEFNEKNRDRELAFFGQEIMLKAEEKGPLTEKAYLDALAKNHRLARAEGIDAVMREHRLDAIVAPSGGPAHATDLLNGDRDGGGSSEPAAVAGYPSITVPAGHVAGLPVGISFFGRAYEEAKLLKLAYAFEQATKARQRPRFLPTLE